LNLAELYSEKAVVAINMIHDDQDVIAKNYSVSADYCRSNDWQQAKVIFDNNIKK